MLKSVNPKINFPEMERKWLSWWEENSILDKYLKKNQNSSKNFSFLDGPITANNPMGVHHAWGRTYKDLWQRFKNMRGFKQRFQNGFDNQGLWVEVEVEKQLGFESKKDIEKFGIENFVNKCKESTLHWAEVQTKQSERLGYFMNWEDSYFTMSDENNYMIWYFLKKCHEKGLLYKGRDSVPWCPRCGTAISQHEILQEEYKEITHDSIFFKLPVAGQANEFFLVWTTTPWTLPGNVALAVNPEFEYSLVTDKSGVNYWLAASLVLNIFGSKAEEVRRVKGSKLVGMKYFGPFDSLPAVVAAQKENKDTFHSVIASKELVTVSEGTGIVHIAPGCGQEDFALGKETKLSVISVIDEEANFVSGFEELSGKNGKENPNVVLENRRLNDYIFEIKPFLHRYPVCWRCKTELVWRVVDEWYISMDELRDPIKKSAKGAKWIPSWCLDREIDWLDNMDDWLISKKRYWGLALPIWECTCGSFEVIGSKEELQERAVEGWDKFEGNSPHRPWIDEVKVKCSQCGKQISRIKDVGNPWLDAGIVPFSTLIDPKTNKVSYLTGKTYFRDWFPADFITECFPGQFKNWFYAILTMSTVLEGRSPFKTLLGHASVRDEMGEEMHKSKGNAIWFDEAVEKIGVDVMRWMYVTQNPALNLNFGYNVANEVRRRFHLLFWNTYNFFVTYANIDKFKVPRKNFYKIQRGRQSSKFKVTNVLDRWILSRLNNTIKTVTESLEKYDAYTASWAIETFVNEFSTWYIRRSRERVGFSATNEKDKMNFYETACTVLLTLAKILAPFTPFLSEEIYKNLVSGESVHLEDWPKVEEDLIDYQLEEGIVAVRQLVEAGHAERKRLGVKVRQPLRKLSIINYQLSIDEDLTALIRDELNVKEVVFEPGEGEMEVELDTKITPRLREEGEAREIVRQIQEERKKLGCKLEERIKVGLPSWPKDFEEDIKKQALVSELYQAERLKVNVSS